MRVFLAGASGVIGVHLVPLLVADGHVVAGMTRSEGRAELVRSLGAERFLAVVTRRLGVLVMVCGVAHGGVVLLTSD